MKIRNLVLCLLFTGVAKSQDLPTILPSTPDIMKLQKFGDTPVGLYTGIPNINIPLYTIQTKSGLSIPITLGYHAGGIKVDEKASRVGLGWSLNAGGVISRQVVGVPDFGQVFPNATTFDPTYTNNGVDDDEDYLYAMGIVEDENYNTADAGYDIYSYRFLGRQGKYFIDANETPQLIPYEKVKIEEIGPLGQAQITDENGNVFYFNRASMSRMELGCPPQVPGNWALNQRSVDFLLNKIVTYTGEEIHFDYIDYEYSYEVSYSETDYLVPSNFGNYGCSVRTKETCTDTIYHVEPILSGIRFGNNTNEIKFFYSDDANYPIAGSNERLDFPGNPALRKIEIWNEYSKVEDYELIYGYFTSNGAGQNPDVNEQRLKLLELVHNNLESHTFEYEEAVNLPARFSFSQDMWGYYNGRQNSTMLPAFTYANDYFTGADRTVNINYSKANTLTKINYPTGGYSEFFYESNTYFDNDGQQTYQEGGVGFQSASQNFQSHQFSIQPGYSNIKIHFTNSCDEPGDPNDPPGVGGECHIEIIDSDNQTAWYQTNNGIYDGTFLSPGDYTLRYMYMGSGCQCQAGITYMESTTTPPGNVLSGGLRVYRVSDFDGQDVMDTFYEYNEFNSTKSSGIVQGTPNFYQISETVKPDNSGTCSYLVRKSNSIFPVAVTGASVGYSNVTTYRKSKSEHGWTEHTFTNSGTSAPNGFFATVLNLEPVRTWERGLETKKAMFNKVGDTVRVMETEYDFDDLFAGQSSDFYGEDKLAATYSIQLKKPEVWQGLSRDPATFEWVYYFLRSSWVKKVWTQKKDFLDSGIVNERVEYAYDPESAQVNEIEKNLSDGSKEITKIYYPDNVNNTQSLGHPYITGAQKTALDSLKTEYLHRVAEPVQVESRVFDIDNNLTSQTYHRTNYEDWSPLVLPISLSTLKGYYHGNDNPMENRIVYESYDENGNPREIKKENGTSITYLWGYHDMHPIAKIENATYSEVSSFESNLKSLSNLDDDSCREPSCNEQTLRDLLDDIRQALPKAKVTTYTYDPLRGITSITAPNGNTIYYEYDSSNRLISIKDREGKYISEHEYHFKGQTN